MSKYSSVLDKPVRRFKVVFLGELSVGKTSLLARFLQDTFNNTYEATLGVDFFTKTMFLSGRTVKMQLWDTAGQERFRAIVPSYIRDSDVAIIVYDIANPKSFQETQRWINQIRAERGNDALIFLVGNKTDLTDERKVSTEQGVQEALKSNVMFAEVSAKYGVNVKLLFKRITELLLGMEVCEKSEVEEVHVILKGSSPDIELTNTVQGGCAC